MAVICHRLAERAGGGIAAEAAELEGEIARLVAAVAPWLLELPGMGTISAAQVLVSWSHAGRLRLGGGLCRAGRCQPDPGVVGPGHPPSAEPRRGPAPEPGAAHRGAGAAA
jgi:hypothetical protein